MATDQLLKQETLNPQNSTSSKLKSESKEKIPKEVRATTKKSKEKKSTTPDQFTEMPADKISTRNTLKKPSKPTPPESQISEQKKKPTKSQKTIPKPAPKTKAASTPVKVYGRPSTPDEPKGEKPDVTSDEPAAAKVKQFSFPGYKILSGASVAPVKMYPQKIVIRRGDDEPPESGPKRWAEGLFQNTTMSLKVRLLRWLMIWLFFRLLNKQTSWLAQKLGVDGTSAEEPGMKPPKGEPGERFIRVFHDGAPHPFHVKVKQGKMDMGKPPN